MKIQDLNEKEKTLVTIALGAISVGALCFFSACSHNKLNQRVWLDSSTHKDHPPNWVSEGKLRWQEKGKVYIRSKNGVRGDERVNGCFDLAHMDAKEALITSISDEVKGQIQEAGQSLNENAELLLTKTRTSEFSGKISGLSPVEEYFERYSINDVERVDCFVLSEISEKDFAATRRAIIDKVVAADPRLKEAMTKNQLKFLGDKAE